LLQGALQAGHLLAGAGAPGDAARAGGRLQPSQSAGIVAVTIPLGKIGDALLFDEHAAVHQQLQGCGR
jgi:hypothetical protein